MGDDYRNILKTVNTFWRKAFNPNTVIKSDSFQLCCDCKKNSNLTKNKKISLNASKRIHKLQHNREKRTTYPIQGFSETCYAVTHVNSFPTLSMLG